jgi:magnesium transporter
MPTSSDFSFLEDTSEKTWEVLDRLVDETNDAALQAYLEELPLGELVFAVSHLSEEDQLAMLERLPPDLAAQVLDEVPYIQATEWLDDLKPESAAAILEELPSDEQADFIGDLEEEDAEAILGEFTPDQARSLRELALYDDEEAGGLMITEFLAYPAWYTVQNVVDDLRAQLEAYSKFPSQYLFVTDEANRLVGVLRMRDLLLSPVSTRLQDMMISDPHSVNHHDDMEVLDDFFDRFPLLGVPVVDNEHKLLGIVIRSDFMEAWGERSDEDYLKSQGVMEEELRSMPLFRRVRGRLAWLTANIFLSIVAASVIAINQDILSSLIALAVFLPIVSGVSGNAGFQAVAVSMRELSMGVVRPEEIGRVMLKESILGLVNGIVLGTVLTLIAWVWKDNLLLGAVVGTAMAVNTIFSAILGGSMPLILKKMKLDPAVASGPILTTLTDMAGFFLVLSLASLFMEKLI